MPRATPARPGPPRTPPPLPALLALAALAAGCDEPAPFPAGADGRPDIVVVSIDSLRADGLSSYGNPRPTSPRLDAAAARGLRFTDARATSSWTLPSHAAMLTGRWPFHHRLVEDTLRLAPTVPLVQERLQAAGYATGGFVSTVYLSERFGFSRGFDTWEEYGVTTDTNHDHTVPVERLAASARAFVEGLPPGRPAFLFLHTYDVHYPYHPPPPFDAAFDPPATEADMRYRSWAWNRDHPAPPDRRERLRAQYDECVRHVDEVLGSLPREWRERGREAYWIFTADHGEELWERSSWGHSYTLNEEVLRVPLLVVGPGIPHAVRDDEASGVDVATTVAAIAGVPFEGDGVDLRAPIAPRARWAETSRRGTSLASLLVDGWRYEVDLRHGDERLYAITADPHERVDHAADEPARVGALGTRLAGAVGEDWSVDAGTVQGVAGLFVRGARVPGEVVGPTRFGAWPPHLPLTWTSPSGATETIDGAGGAPDVGPLRYEGARTVLPVTLGDDVRAKLEALGYVQ